MTPTQAIPKRELDKLVVAQPRIIVPFTHLQWATQLALTQDGLKPEYEHMRTEWDYFNLIERCWRDGQTFFVIEHDIVPWPGAVQTLTNCSHGWCTLPYYCSVGWIEDGLGFTKFSASLIRQHPNFFKEPFPACCQHSKHYCGLDRLIAHRMQELGIKPHVHAPGVVNCNAQWTT